MEFSSVFALSLGFALGIFACIGVIIIVKGMPEIVRVIKKLHSEIDWQ